MPILHYEYVLLDVAFQCLLEELLEEGNKLAQFTYLAELMLKWTPYIMRVFSFSLALRQENFLFHNIIVSLWLAVEGSELSTLEIAISNYSIFLWVNFEQIFSFIVIHTIIISQCNIGLDRIRRRRMNMMVGTLGHSIKRPIYCTSLNGFFVLEEALNQYIMTTLKRDFVTHLQKLEIGFPLGNRKCCFLVPAESHFHLKLH